MRRKLRIHRLSMPPGQIEQLSMLLQTAPPEQLSRVFQGAPIDAIRSEIEGEKRKLDVLVNSTKAVKTYEAMDPTVKRQQDREAWKDWCSRYADRMVQLLAEDMQNQRSQGMILSHTRSAPRVV
jgi:hypothetical protein